MAVMVKDKTNLFWHLVSHMFFMSLILLYARIWCVLLLLVTERTISLLLYWNSLELKGSRSFPLHFEDFPLSIEVLYTFPAFGSVLRVSTSQSFKEIPRLLGGGQWVRLLNMFCELHNGIWNGTLQFFSEIQLLSDEDSIVRHCSK